MSSAGLERALKKPEHFGACMGQTVDVKLYRARDGQKEFTGVLEGYDNGDVTVAGTTFPKPDVAAVKLHVTF